MWAHDIDDAGRTPAPAGADRSTAWHPPAHHVARGRTGPRAVDAARTRILGHRDRPATRPRRRSWSSARDGAVVGGVQPGRPPRPLRRRRAGDRQPGPRRAAHPGDRRGAGRGGRRRSASVDAVAATYGPGLVGSLLVGRERGQGPGAGRGTCPSSPSTTSRPTSTPRSSRSPTSSCPLVVLLVSGGHTMLVRDGGPRALPVLGLHPRRRRRRGLRQGGPLPRASATPGARPSTGSPSRATRPPSPSPGRCSTTATTSPSAA